MTTKLEELKAKRDQLNARIQKAEARAKAAEKKLEDRVKVLVGAAVLSEVRSGGLSDAHVRAIMRAFLARESEVLAVLGEDGTGSETYKRLTGLPSGLSGGSEAAQDDDGGADTKPHPDQPSGLSGDSEAPEKTL